MTFISGPRLTTSNLNTIQGEDHLGIKNVAIIMADTLQAGITSITPRARYWAFFSWVLHDFIQTQSDKSLKNFKNYLKTQEWFYIVANIADMKNKSGTINQLVGVTKGLEVWEKEKTEIPVCHEYLKNSFGGFNIYRNVMKILGVTKDGDMEKGVQVDRLTPVGKKLAELFQKNIENTRFFKEWRHNFNDPIPKDVLIEYGTKAGLSRLQHSYDLDILRKLFLPEGSDGETERLRFESLSYYQYITNINQNKNFTHGLWRYYMYDVFSIKGEEKRKIPSQYQVVALGWELYQGRQLFTYSLESIWSFILDILSLKLLSIKQLVDLILKELNKESLPIDKPLSSLQDLFPLKRKRRELFLSKMINDNLNVIERVWNPLLVLLEVYYRFRNRHDLKQIHIQFKELGEVNHLSLKRWEDDIKNYWNQPIKELIQYIIKSYILQQHAQVALNKVLSTGNDTYHFVENNGKLHFLKNNKPSYNVFRVNQAMTILEDLGEI